MIVESYLNIFTSSVGHILNKFMSDLLYGRKENHIRLQCYISMYLIYNMQPFQFTNI